MGRAHSTAVSDACTHLGCSVRYEARDHVEKLACNCHNSFFTLKGENLSGPAPAPLKEYDVEVSDGIIRLSRKDDGKSL